MQVTVGAEWPTSSAGRRSYAVTLDEDDLRTMLPEDAELPASAVARLDMMSKRAEILVLRYVHRGVRCRGLRSAQVTRWPDTDWCTRCGKAPHRSWSPTVRQANS
jgi:hypothetical protein